MAAYIGRIQDADGADVYPQVKKEGIIDFPTDLLQGKNKDSGWTSAGVTFLNGSKPGEEYGIKYRTIDFLGGGTLVEVRGSVSLNGKAEGYGFQLPTKIIPQKTMFLISSSPDTTYAVNDDGRVYVWNPNTKADARTECYFTYLAN
jgi:hypothetical protein